MNNSKKINFESVKNYLKQNSVDLKTDLDVNTNFNNINSIDRSSSEDLTFFHNSIYLKRLKTTEAKACLIQKQYLSYLNKKCVPIIVDDPYLAYALISNLLCPSVESNGQIHQSVQINSEVSINENVQINANVIIKSKCVIKNNVIILENSVIGPDVVIGIGTKIMSNCVISNAELGNNCFIQPGVVIGGKGFGFTPEHKIEVKHIGNVKIGNNVDIGSNSTIDRGTIDSTIIGNNCRIDNLVQIAHNVNIGANTIIASQSGISGSTKLGNNCIVGGQVGLAGHLEIGNNVKIAGKSGVTKNFPDNCTIGGFPARDIRIWRKSIVKQYKNLK